MGTGDVEAILTPEALRLTRELIWAVDAHPEIHVNRFTVRQPSPGKYDYFLGHHRANAPTPLRQHQVLDHNMVPQLQFLGLVDTATGEHVPPNWFRFTEKAIEWYRQQQADQERIVAIVEPVQALQEAKGVDVFISHAWEDKEEFVRGLAEALVARGLNVWYDDFTLKVGDRLRESIDHGLRESRFGVVVLSPAFFAKNWTAYELNGLVTKSMSGSGEKIILPVWHNVKADEVREYSLSLADIVALNTNRSSVEAIAAEIAAVVAH